ncbi:MAG: riboflavin synthase [Actinobacteria bacterium]|nr:riboflavin synthase [Actinomycetota bacterium]
MFTGLIEYVGQVTEVRVLPTGKQLQVELGPLAEGLRTGDSVAVDGVCLTVTAIKGSVASFDVVATTLAKATLGGLSIGRGVNLERPITLQDRLGGHLVAGHVDGTASLQKWSRASGGRIAHFKTDAQLTDFMIPQGSVALGGVSLTVADLTNGTFSVALIPTTLARTNLGQLRVGQSVNVETDLIGKYVAKLLATKKMGQVTMETLREHGFV